VGERWLLRHAASECRNGRFALNSTQSVLIRLKAIHANQIKGDEVKHPIKRILSLVWRSDAAATLAILLVQRSLDSQEFSGTHQGRPQQILVKARASRHKWRPT